MAILNHGSTLRTADGGQTTTTIVTAANIGTYGVATNATYYVGTTQNIFNRASGAQTLTGVSIDGNAATATNVAWSGITSKPTTFSGFGISDLIYGSTGSRNVWTITNWNQTTYPNAHFLSSEGNTTNAPSTDFIYGLQTAFHRDGASYRTQMVSELYSSPVSIWVRNSRDSDVWTAWSKLLHSNNYSSYSAFTSSLTSTVDARAPIFYDSNDTTYYIDPASTSRVVALWVRGSSETIGNIYVGGTSAGNRLNISYDQIWTSTAHLYFQYSGAGNIDMNYGGGYAFSRTSLRAPIFYDFDNTAYYLDPANTGTSLLVAGSIGVGITSLVHKIQAAGLISAGDATYNNNSTFIGAILNNDQTNPGLDLRRWNGGGAGTDNHGATYIATNSAGDTLFYNGLIAANTRATSEKMRISVAGNVGIGTTSPSLISGYVGLNVVNAGYTQIKLQSSASSAGIEFKPSSGNNWELQANTSSQWFVFDRTQDVYRLLINSSGNVGIGTASPSQKLDVSGAINASTYVYAGVFYDNDNTVYYTNPSGTSNLVGLTVANTIAGSVSGNAATATTSALLTSSDVRTISPSSANASRLTYGFTSYSNNNTGSWADYLHLRSYADGTGGNDNLVMFNKNAIGMRIWQQAFGSATAYATYKDVAFTDQGFYIGTTSVAINRSSASQTLTGVSIDGSSASCTGNAATATILQTARNINGTSFNGSAAITTASWGTARTLTIGSTGKSVDGSAAVSWSLAELGAAATNQTMFIGTTSVAINRASASQTLTGISIDGNAATATNGLTTSNYVSYSAFTASLTSTVDARAPIFYDSNNTAYYINPAGNSIVSSLTFDSNITIYKHNDRNLLIQGGGGTDAGLLGRGSSGQFAFQVYGNGSGSYGFLDGAWAGWDIRKVVDGDLFLNDNNTYYLNPASTTNLNNLTVAGDVRSPIFYDSNNTAYYLDPAGTNSLYYIVMPHIANGSPNLVVNNSASENWNAIKINGGNDNNGIGFSNTSHSAFARNNLSFHTHNLDSIRFHSSGWDTLFEVAGSSGNAWLKGGSFDSSFTRLVNPGGAYYVTGTSTITGAIKIRLPRLKVDTMMRMTVKIYQYNTGQSATIECGGYDYSGDGIWRNIFAYQNSDLFATVNVRFGNDGTYDCVWIGETSSTWSYPQVFVTDFQAGYNNYTSAWGTGWNISYVTAFDTVTDTRVAYKTLNASNYNSYAPTLTGTGASGTWNINVTGNAATATSATYATTINAASDITVNGIKAGRGVGNIISNAVFGRSALNANTTGVQNNAFGRYALYSNTSGRDNCSFGIQNLYYNTIGNYNTAFGNLSMLSNVNGSGNCAFGYGTLNGNIAATGNTAMGKSALSVAEASHNSAFGHESLVFNNTGYKNSAFGSGALRSNLSGNLNCAFGYRALYSNQPGNKNNAFGYKALLNNVSGGNNNAFGYYALKAVTGGNNNTAIGQSAGSNITTGNNNTCIGQGSAASSASVSNEITLGNSSISSLRCAATSISSLSDLRDKADIEDVNIGLSFVEKIRPVTFKWDKREWYANGNRDGTKKDLAVQSGFIAQDLKKLQEEFGVEFLKLAYESNPEKLEATPANLLIPLIKAVQELNEKVKTLENKVRILENR